LWKQIVSRTVGLDRSTGESFFALPDCPRLGRCELSPLQLPVEGGSRLNWILLEKIPNDVIWRRIDAIRTTLWMSVLLVIVILGALFWFGSRTFHRRKQVTQELKESSASWSRVWLMNRN